MLHLTVRCCNLQGHERTDLSERDALRVTREMTIPSDAAAIVLVDVWDRHYLSSHQQRATEIVTNRLVPLLEACRSAGIAVVHAPAPEAARKYESWLQYAGDAELFGAPSGPAPSWPPAEFRHRQGEYAQYARPSPSGELAQLIDAQRRDRRIVPQIHPREGDFVVATGDQLHRLCRHRRILHLFFAGFATNMCVMARDYGIRQMARRGYNCILIRDCTTGIESAETLDSLSLTEAAVWEVEMLHGFTVDSTELIAACERG